MKTLFSLLLIILIAPQMSAQNNVSPAQPIALGMYIIDPVNKTVSRQEYFERDEPNGIHAWGYDVVPDTTINYNTTCLYILDHYIEFKEHYKPVTPEAVNEKQEPINLSDYQPFGNYYKKGSNYYFLTPKWPKQIVKKLDIGWGINFEGLTAAGMNYYYDANGLYYIDKTDGEKLTKIASGNKHVPVVKRTYCLYNGKVYMGGKKFNVDPLLLKEIDMQLNGRYVHLTDGNKIYMPVYTTQKEVPGISRWKQLSAGQRLKVVDNCVHLSLHEYGNGDILFASPDGFFTVSTNFDRPQKYDKVFIYNHDTKQEEEIDVSEFTLYQKDFYTYKGKSYYKWMPIVNEIDMPRLKYVKEWNGNATNWFTDGKRLFNLDCMQTVDKTSVSFDDEVLVANIGQLRIVDKNLLVDDVNFYSLSYRRIQVIPIKSLGLEVQILTSIPAYPSY